MKDFCEIRPLKGRPSCGQAVTNTLFSIGVVEHYIVSTVASVVPQPVRQTIRELWDSAKSKFTTITGDSETPEKAESLGRWGVEEAQERHAEEASE